MTTAAGNATESLYACSSALRLYYISFTHVMLAGCYPLLWLLLAHRFDKRLPAHSRNTEGDDIDNTPGKLYHSPLCVAMNSLFDTLYFVWARFILAPLRCITGGDAHYDNTRCMPNMSWAGGDVFALWAEESLPVGIITA